MDDINQAKRRAYQYWYSDGLAEIISGSIFVLVSLLIYLQMVISVQSLLGKLVLALYVIGTLLGALWGRRVIHYLKERITYPRTGYVDYKKSSPTRRYITLGIGAVLGVVWILLFQQYPDMMSWYPFIPGLSVGLLFAVLGYRINLPRFYIFALISCVISAVLATMGLRGQHADVCYFGSMGTALLVSGVVILWRYLRATPSQDKSAL